MKYAVNFLLLLALVFSVSAFAEDKDDVLHRLDAAAADLDRLTNAPDKGIPQDILTGAKCIAIVPNLVKAGFIFGGEGRSRCRHLPHRGTTPLECAGILHHRRR